MDSYTLSRSHDYDSSAKKNIGGGAFGSVVYDEYNPKIAIKNCTPRDFEYSLKETTIINYLSHPNIIKFLSINFSDDGSCKIFMKRYEGSLHGNGWLEYAARIRKSPSTLLLRIICEITSAVSYMHSCGIIHADLKPQNILYRVTADTIRPVICDFNTSILEINDHMYTHIQTLNYRAPEVNEKYAQSADIKRCYISDKIDVWSIGCIAYEMFTGCVFLRPTYANTPSWLLAAKAFNVPIDKFGTPVDFADKIKINLFSMSYGNVIEVVKSRILNTNWQELMKLTYKYGTKNGDIAMHVMELFVEVIGRCLIPDPQRRIASSDLFNFISGICVDITDMEIPAVAIPQQPRFRIDLFEPIIDDELHKITQYGNSPEVFLTNYKRLADFMLPYKSAYLMSKIIELKYYEKKRVKKLMSETGFQISLAACIISSMLLEIRDIKDALREHVVNDYVVEITSTLSGDLL